MSDFNPHSVDAMFATVLARLAQQDERDAVERAAIKARLDAIHEQVCRTNGRVTKLETFRTALRAKVAAIALVVSAAVGLVGFYWDHWKR